jgi:hypothetical protein
MGKYYIGIRSILNTMRVIRPFRLLVLLLLIALAVAAMTASAGSSSSPEVSDGSDDAVTGRNSHDIIKAWVGESSNASFTITMQMTALDTVSPLDDWTNLPTTTYEFYFTLEGDDYCVRATLPVHGPLAAPASYGLYEVTYDGSEISSYEYVLDPFGQLRRRDHEPPVGSLLLPTA